jgi:hypothetical protein
MPAVLPDRPHDGGSGRHGAASQVIPVGKTARQNDEIGSFGEPFLPVPDGIHFTSEGVPDGMNDILVTVAPRKNDDGGLHLLSLHFDAVLFDYGVDQEIVTHLFRFFPGAGCRIGFDPELDVLPDFCGSQGIMTEGNKRIGHRFSLDIENALLELNKNMDVTEHHRASAEDTRLQISS